jgi:ribosomal protein S27E
MCHAAHPTITRHPADSPNCYAKIPLIAFIEQESLFMKCPRCNRATLAFDWSIGTMVCPECQYKLYEDDRAASPPAAPAPPPAQTAPTNAAPFILAAGELEAAINEVVGQTTPAQQAPIPFKPPGGLDMDDLPEYLSGYSLVRMRGRLQTAQFAIGRGDRAEIKKALQAVLQISSDHADTWLHLAAIADTAEEQRECLENVIASAPGHPIAMRIMAQLDGELPPDAAEASDNDSESDGKVASQRLVCPQCGGGLTYDEREKAVTCKFCGYMVVDADDLDRTDTHSTVLAGNVKRKRAAKNWNIGQKWLHCTSCGSITTLSRNTLTSTCRFCDSRHVLQESVTAQFEEPDLIVPFSIDEQAAHAAVEKHLRSGIRRITRLFADAIDRIELKGSYLSFWVFDADMIVNWSWTNAPASGKHPVLLSDVLFLSAPTPPIKLTEKIEPYDLRQGVDYDPRLLAVYPAQLYDMDMTQASIDVRPRLSREACRKAETGLRVRRPAGYGNDDDPGRLQTNAYTQFLTYRLALLPIWVGQLIEEDGDTQQVLVNGQTGRVTLGKLQRQDGN